MCFCFLKLTTKYSNKFEMSWNNFRWSLIFRCCIKKSWIHFPLESNRFIQIHQNLLFFKDIFLFFFHKTAILLIVTFLTLCLTYQSLLTIQKCIFVEPVLWPEILNPPSNDLARLFTHIRWAITDNYDGTIKMTKHLTWT